jgi:hypothetical protein
MIVNSFGRYSAQTVHDHESRRIADDDLSGSAAACSATFSFRRPSP